VVQPILLPVEPTGYHRFYRVPGRAWWWSLIVVAGSAVAWLMVSAVAMVIAMLAGVDLGLSMDDPLGGPTSLGMFLLNNVLLALSLPLLVLFSWLVYRQGWGWLTSVVGRMRWRWLAGAAGLAFVLLALQWLLETAITGWPKLASGPDTMVLVVGILLTTPLQAAAEEYLTRGLLSRAVAALFRSPRLGLALAWLVSSVTFVALHMAEDVWLNLYYFGVATGLWWVTHRSGGLEAAVAYHICNNLISEALLPWTGLSDIFERGPGAGSPLTLLPLAGMAVYAVLVEYAVRRFRLTRTAAPGAALATAIRSATTGPGPWGPNWPGGAWPGPGVPGPSGPVPGGHPAVGYPGPGGAPGLSFPGPGGAPAPGRPNPGWAPGPPSGGSGAGPDGQLDQSDQRRPHAQFGHPGFDQAGGQFGPAGDVAADGHRAT
jgi:membrane protease YdiL (CAAX protease family)